MPTDQPSDLGWLSDRDYQRLLELIAPFEQACEEAHGQHTLIDVAPYVPRPDEPLFRHVLHELVKIHLDYRWSNGHPARLEDYVARFSGLGTRDELPVKLILEEYRVRRRVGDRPPLEEYRDRFPRQFAELERLVEADPEPTLVPPTTLSAHELELTLGGRYELQQELGRGGMGVVYRAYDRQERRPVALKTMHNLDPAALMRFNNEFRALVDLTHPNLVALYELAADGDRRYFTMELVTGTNLLAHVRQSSPPPPRDTVRDAATGVPADAAARPVGPPLTPDQIARLRNVIGQLTEALLYLHDAGRLHRDIKPGNVMVTPEGVVKLLDFGLVVELDRDGLHQSTEPHILGTVAYMAPEQAAGLPSSPATDWYAIGVMLFEGLTGRLPFEGRPMEILLAKQVRDAPSPREILSDVPDDLNALAVDLMRREPAARPTGHDVLRRLGFRPGEVRPPPPRGPRQAPFVGRQRHLDFLTQAFHELLRSRSVTVFVHGRSGAGKTALVQRFLDGLERRGEAVVLRGRCYEQESVPYKALDSVIDALSRFLGRLPTLEAQTLLPRDVSILARIFPVLGRVPAIATAPRRGLDITDPQELRRRALAALRELLARLGDARRLVIAIDDLQWGDVDSAALLLDLTRPPDPPVMVLVGCYRDEDAKASACLQTLLKDDPGNHLLARRELSVERLTEEEGRELALALMNQSGTATDVQAEIIARESGGSPFFVYELVQHFQTTPEPAEPSSSVPGDVTLNEVLWSRILRLPQALRRLLEVLAVAGRPERPELVCRAAGSDSDERPAFTYLRASRLLRTTVIDKVHYVETYHDRIRQTIVSHLEPEARRRHHQKLAEVMEEASRVSDSEALEERMGVHFRGAGLNERAAFYFGLAAEKAAKSLAFDHAAKLYRLALELPGLSREAGEQRRLRQRLADALANAGRGRESAAEYLLAADGAEAAEARELRRRAAMRLLMCGQVDEGVAVLERVLTEAGMSMPDGAWGLVRLGYRRAEVWLRDRLFGLKFTPRTEAEVPPELLAQINVCWAAGAGLSMVDVFQGIYFQTRGLQLALKAGEPYHLARSLALEVAHQSIGGTHTWAKTTRLLRAAEDLAKQVNQPYLNALVLMARNTATALAGDWPEAVRLGDAAEKLFREECTGVSWELDTVHRFTIWPLMFMGDVPEIARRLPALLKEAQERDNLYGMTTLSLGCRTFWRLASDQPGRARDELGQVMVKWSSRGYHVQHMNRLFDECRIDLYEGRPADAWRRLTEGWPALERSPLLKVQQVNVFCRHVRGSCALALLRAGGDAEKLLAEARAEVAALLKEGAEWATALGLLLESAVLMEGKDVAGGKALDRLRAAVSLCQKTSMHLAAAAGMRRLSQLCGGDEARRFRAEATRVFAEREVHNPARMTSLLAPGFPDDVT